MNEASLLLRAAVVMKYSEDSLCLHERENLVVLAQSLSIPGHDMGDVACFRLSCYYFPLLKLTDFRLLEFFKTVHHLQSRLRRSAKDPTGSH